MNTADVGALATEAVDFFIEAVDQIPFGRPVDA
jgi:hypothetical protein